MPVVGISTARLRKLLGREIESERLAEAIDRIGCDLEEVAEVVLHECGACGGIVDRLPREDAPKECPICGSRSEKALPEVGRDEMVRLDLLPARPDLFDSAGLARALLGYLDIEKGRPEYPVHEGEVVVRVEEPVLAVRPEIACAEVVMPPIDRETLVEIMQLQENLHWAVGRDRKKASIGVYDLSKHGTEIRWTALPTDHEFVPLGMPGKRMTLAGILAEHPKGKRYAHLLEGYDRYPVLVDAVGQVLSMPPIINSEETKLTEGATRLFVDVTGPDPRSVREALVLLVTSLAELGGEVKGVRIESPDGAVATTPDLSPAKATLSRARAERLIGVELPPATFLDHLARMRLGTTGQETDEPTVLVPCYRTDVKHEVDLIEDVAIAHGYHELPSPLVPTMTVGHEHPASRLSRQVREALTGLGFFEVLNFMLTNREEHFSRMRLPGDMGEVQLANPISVNQEIVRVHLLSGLLGTYALNKTREMPQPLFEVGDVSQGTDDSSSQRLHLGIGVAGPRADYAEIRATVDALLHELAIDGAVAAAPDHELAPVFLEGRVASVTANGTVLGVMGEVHPEVIVAFGLDHPVVLAELDLSALLP